MLLVQTAFICANELAYRLWLEPVLTCIKASEVGKCWDLAEHSTDLPTSNANIETCLKDAMMHSMWQHSCSVFVGGLSQVQFLRWCGWSIVLNLHRVSFPDISLLLLSLVLLENQNPPFGELLWLFQVVGGFQGDNKIRVSSVSLLLFSTAQVGCFTPIY